MKKFIFRYQNKFFYLYQEQFMALRYDRTIKGELLERLSLTDEFSEEKLPETYSLNLTEQRLQNFSKYFQIFDDKFEEFLYNKSNNNVFIDIE